MNAVALSLITLFSTTAGGLCALRLGDRLPLVLGFTAGVLLGVVSFDLLPESLELARRLGGSGHTAMIALVAGFLLFHCIEKLVLARSTSRAENARHQHPSSGMLSAAALIAHSFMDGVSIGLAFQVSQPVGFTVAIAVIAHDFCDGLNTVSLMLVNRNAEWRSKAMLLLDAIAPVAGAACTLLFEVPPSALALYLGFFAGFLLYIGAADILPEAHSQAAPTMALGLIATTCAGAGLMYLVSRLA